MNWLWVCLFAVGVVLVYIRLAPSDAARWHKMGTISGDKDFKGGVIRVVTAGPEALATLDAYIRATARTTVLAGRVDEGMVTYVTRSNGMGFPDYTTVRQTDQGLEIYGRLRFGKSDFGVNKARVEKWLALGQF